MRRAFLALLALICLLSPALATGLPVVTHNYLPGLWFTVSQSARNAALEASPLLILGADRDAANAGAPRATFVIALGPGQSLDRFVGMHVSPLMGGADYSFEV